MEANVKTKDDTLEKVKKIQEADQLKRQALRELLEAELRDDEHILVSRSHMGEADSWLGSASFRWIAERISLFTQLPLFRSYVDEETGQLRIDAANVEDLRQRAPNPARQEVLTSYLVRQRHRKFPPMLAVISEPWVDQPDDPEWGEDGRATKTSIPLEPLDESGRVGILNLTGEPTIYVLDGSHRLLGIRGVMHLRRDGQLDLRNSKGKPVGTKSLDDFLSEFELSESRVAGIEAETMGIDFIPAVLEGETREEARRRVRSVFVHVNKTAQPPTYGETTILDDDDGFAVTAKRIALSHSLLHQSRAGDRVNWKTTALPAGSAWLTAAVTLRDMAQAYMQGNPSFVKWVTKRKEVAVRPSDHELDDGEQRFRDLIDRLAKLPSFADIQRGTPIEDWREFPPKGKGHLLMRPLGQLALAEAVGFLHEDVNGPQMPLDEIFEKLARYDEEHGFEGVDKPSSIWYGVTYNPSRGTMSMAGRSTAVGLLEHLLHGLPKEERDELEDRFREARTIRRSETEAIAFNYDGKELDDPRKVTLPPMI